MEETVKKFKAHLAKMQAYNHANSILYYDSVTSMPKGGTAHLGNTMAVLSEETYKLTVSEELKAMVREILAHKEEVDYVTRREAEELNEEMLRTEKIPMEEYVAYSVAVNEASAVWHEAKEKSDYALFEPHLAKIIDYNRRFAAYWNSEKPAYDVLLDIYEKGLTMDSLDRFFGELREQLAPLVRAIAKKQQPDDAFAHKSFSIAKQRLFSDYLMKVMTIDRDHCNIGETEHPFTINFSKDDVRITTHYHEKDFLSSMFSVIHEGGHALYELHIGDNIKYSPLGSGASMGIHESQSRFFENIIGRSEPFVSYILPEVKKLNPRVFRDVTAHDFYLAANRSEPSLVRTEADELTYSFHIMIRYELEKKLIAGTLSTKELPAEWNRLYKEYLGVTVPNDREGVLQDSHWSGGSFGYFPSYAIGSAYAAQMLSSMEKDIPVWTLVGKGDLKPVVDWLAERIYQYGCLLKPKELIEKACGADFDPDYYVAYLRDKYTKVYGL